MTTRARRPAKSAGQLLIAGFDGTEPSPEILALIRAGLGGVILYRKNCVDAAQVLELTNRLQETARAAGHAQPLLIAIDQEQGRVVRLTAGVTVFPAMGAIASVGDANLVERVAAATSRELLAIGVNWNLAPVADVLSVPDCPVGDRSFGTDPAQVAKLVAAFVRGAAAAGMRTCAKHFPGHGSTGKDSHVAAPIVKRERAGLEACDLPPFRAAIQAGIPAVMTTHITFPALDPDAPASLSKRVIDGLLRQQLGFTGVVVSDDLEMAGISLSHTIESAGLAALRAGTDLLIVSRMLLAERCIPGLLADLRLAVRDETVAATTVVAALRRVRRFKQGLDWHADPAAARTVLRAPEHLDLLEEIERRALG
ncbi:MAG: beta-N-acetylhexosaminidase [Candidatus Methylomirabilia bacterium]